MQANPTQKTRQGQLHSGDVQAVRDGADIRVIYRQHTGRDPRRNRGWPLCCNASGASEALSFSDDGKVAHCHRCGWGGDAITLIRKVEGLGFHDAVVRVAQLCGIAIGAELNPQTRGRLERASRKRQAEIRQLKARREGLRRRWITLMAMRDELRDEINDETAALAGDADRTAAVLDELALERGRLEEELDAISEEMHLLERRGFGTDLVRVSKILETAIGEMRAAGYGGEGTVA